MGIATDDLKKYMPNLKLHTQRQNFLASLATNNEAVDFYHYKWTVEHRDRSFLSSSLSDFVIYDKKHHAQFEKDYAIHRLLKTK